MAPLIILVVVTFVLLVAGWFGVRWLRPWPVAVRGGLVAMFTATGLAHFVGMRAELVAMVPPALPAPQLLVTVTGVLELIGAAGLLWRRSAGLAAAGLGLMLIGMFPANVYKALTDSAPAWEDRLIPRTVLQVIFLGAVACVVWQHFRGGGQREEQATVGP